MQNIHENRTMVAVRVISEAFDAEVKWNSDLCKVEIFKDIAAEE